MSDRIRAETASDPPPERPLPEPVEPREREAPPPPPPAETPHEEPPPAGTEQPAAAPEVLPAAVQQRIDRLIRERYEARRQLQEYQDRVAEIERQQQAARLPPGQVDLREQARAEVREELETRIFNEQCNTLFAKGRDEYGAQMDEARDALNAVGWGMNRRALEALTQLRDGHRVYRELARDLDNAARILNLPESARALELARLEVRAGGNGTGAERQDNDDAAVTRAPDPIRPIGGSSRRSELPLDSPKLTMAEFIRRRDRDERKSRISR